MSARDRERVRRIIAHWHTDCPGCATCDEYLEMRGAAVSSVAKPADNTHTADGRESGE